MKKVGFTAKAGRRNRFPAVHKAGLSPETKSLPALDSRLFHSHTLTRDRLSPAAQQQERAKAAKQSRGGFGHDG